MLRVGNRRESAGAAVAAVTAVCLAAGCGKPAWPASPHVATSRAVARDAGLLLASIPLDGARGSPALAADERSIVVAVGRIERGPGDLFVLDRDGEMVHRAAVDGAAPLIVPSREGGVEILWIGGELAPGDAGVFAGTRVRAQHVHPMFFGPVAAEPSPRGMFVTWRGGCMVTETRLVAYDGAGERGGLSWPGVSTPITAATARGALVFRHGEDGIAVASYDDRLTLGAESWLPLPESTVCERAIRLRDRTALVCSDRTFVFDDAGTLVQTIPTGALLLDNAITHRDRVWIASPGPVGDPRVCLGPLGVAPVACMDVHREPFAMRPAVALATQGDRLLFAFITGEALEIRAID